jgi:hypothetical protein
MNEKSDCLSKARILEPYEEIVGTLEALEYIDGLLIASFRSTKIFIPTDMDDRIRPSVGQKVAILRTDIPSKQYLFRLLDQELHSKREAHALEDCS